VLNSHMTITSASCPTTPRHQAWSDQEAAKFTTPDDSVGKAKEHGDV
jgi:hypothetical protein